MGMRGSRWLVLVPHIKHDISVHLWGYLTESGLSYIFFWLKIEHTFTIKFFEYMYFHVFVYLFWLWFFCLPVVFHVSFRNQWLPNDKFNPYQGVFLVFLSFIWTKTNAFCKSCFFNFIYCKTCEYMTQIWSWIMLDFFFFNLKPKSCFNR